MSPSPVRPTAEDRICAGSNPATPKRLITGFNLYYFMTKHFWIFEKPQNGKELNFFLKKSLVAIIITSLISAFALVLMFLSSDSASVLKFGFIALLSAFFSMLAYFEAELQLIHSKKK